MGADKPAEGCAFEHQRSEQCGFGASCEGTFAQRLSGMRKK